MHATRKQVDDIQLIWVTSFAHTTSPIIVNSCSYYSNSCTFSTVCAMISSHDCCNSSCMCIQFYVELAAILYIHIIVTIIMKNHGTSSTRSRLDRSSTNVVTASGKMTYRQIVIKAAMHYLINYILYFKCMGVM